MQPPPRKSSRARGLSGGERKITGNYAKFLKTLHAEQVAKLQAKNQYECDLLEDVRSFVLKRSAIERSYAEALLKISSVYLNKKIPNVPDIKGDGGDEKWNMWSVWRTVLEENERLSRARLAAVEVFQQQVADDAKVLRQHKISNSKRCLDQLAIVQKELQLCVQELDKYKKIYFDEEHCAHDVRDRAKDIEEKLKKKKGSFFQSITSLQKNSAKISSKRDASDQKSAGARNDYLLSLAATNAHQNRYFVVDLQNAITTMEAGVYDRVAEYLTLIGRTELLTCHAMQTSFGRIKDQAMQLTRDYNIQCLYLLSPSLKQHIQYQFEPCDEDPIATVTPLESGGPSSGDTAGLAKEARRWATRIGRETATLREGIRKLNALQALRDSGQKTDPNDPNGPDLDTKIDDLRQSLRRSETAKMKAEARIECLRNGGVNVDEWLQDVESLGVLEIPRSASSLSVRTDATGEPVSSDSFYDSDYNDAGSEVTAVERGAGASKKESYDDEDEDEGPKRGKGSQKKKTKTGVSIEQEMEGKILEDEDEDEEEVTEQVASVVEMTSAATAGWDVDPTQVDWGEDDNAGSAPTTAASITTAEEEFRIQGMEAPQGRSPGTTYKCIALYSYTAQNPDELSIVEGEALEVIIGGGGGDEDDEEGGGMGGEGDGWVKARNYQGEEGLVPQNYLEAALDDGGVGSGGGDSGGAGSSGGGSAGARGGFHTQFSFSSVDYHVEDSAGAAVTQKAEGSPKPMVPLQEEEPETPKIVEEVHTRRFQPPANICINGVGGDAPNYCIALYDYEATCPEELTFPEGCILRIIRKSGTAATEDGEEVDDGWWEGEAPDGSRGLFPSLVVEPCRPNGEPLTPQGDESPPGSAPPVFTPPDVPTYLLPPQHVFVTQPTPDVEEMPITEEKPPDENGKEEDAGPPPSQPPPSTGFSMELAKGKQHHYKKQFGDQGQGESEKGGEPPVPSVSIEAEDGTKLEDGFEDDFVGDDGKADEDADGGLGVAQIVITAATPMMEEAETPFPGTEGDVGDKEEHQEEEAKRDGSSEEEERLQDEGTESDRSQVVTAVEKSQEPESESGMSTSAIDETASDGSKGTIEEMPVGDPVGDVKMDFDGGRQEEFVELSDELEPTQLERLRGLKESDA
ncbi:protein nervous wreck isoform X1 [Ischnura elegans]|uniref:protein nervous wreck isoform X1 n=1 Tax=Ischnura elegans TaxID=197161 RepID=UPI001ED8A122|nr:protein nervous wreck isoform X1 [Ischnura elegans]